MVRADVMGSGLGGETLLISARARLAFGGRDVRAACEATREDGAHRISLVCGVLRWGTML